MNQPLLDTQVALESLTLRGGTVSVTIAGEVGLRHFENVDAVLRLGRDYHSMHVDLTAQPQERDPSADKCTMMSPRSQRHIRRNAGPQDPIVGPPSGSVLPDRSETRELLAESQLTSLPGMKAARGPPTGGHLRVKLSVTDLMVDGKSPDLQVCKAPLLTCLALQCCMEDGMKQNAMLKI